MSTFASPSEEARAAGPVVRSPADSAVRIRIARRYLRLGKTFASTLAVGGGAGVALALLVTTPNLRADQVLMIAAAFNVLNVLMAACAWKAAQMLPVDVRWLGVAKIWMVFGLVQIAYSFLVPVSAVTTAFSLHWWESVIGGAIYAMFGVLGRELFFAEFLEQFPPPQRSDLAPG